MLKFLDHNLALRRIVRVGLFLLIGVLVACSSTPLPEQQASVSTLRVVMDNNYPPYVFQNEQGQLQGILIDQWKLWEDRTGVKVEITALPWGDALKRMTAGEFDVIDTIFYTADRAEIFDFTVPNAQINVRIFFQKNISGIANAEDLKGFRVAVKTGDADVDYLKEQGITDLIYYDSYESIVQAAKNKEVTIFVIDQPPALYFLYKYGIQGQFNYSEPLFATGFHRAVLKGNASILALVKDGFSRITKSEYQAIDDRWFGSGLSSGIQQIMPYLVAGAVIALLAILLLFAFNRMLRSRVKSRTVELQEALSGLQKSEARFRDAIEFFPVPIGIADVQGNILSFNRKFIEYYGYTTEDVPSVAEWMRHAYPDAEYRTKVQARWDEDVANAVRAETSTVLREYRVTCKDGSQRDVEIVMSPISGLWVTSFNNVSERKQAEESLRENEAIFSAFLEHSPVYVFFKDKDIRSLRLSKNYEQMLGIPIDAALGKTMDELFPSELAKSMVADDLRILKEGQRIDVVEEFNGRVYETTKFPILKDGQPFMLAGFTVDITERRRSIEVLQQSEKRFRALIENSADAVTLLNADGSVFYVGPTVNRLTGYPPAERLGRSGFDNVYPADLPLVKSTLGEVLAAPNNSTTVQYRSIKKDGSIWWLEATATNLLHEASVQAIVVNYRDITERKQAEDELRESETRFRILFEHAGVGVALVDTQTGKFMHVNQKYCDIVGYTREEMEQLDFPSITHPDDLQKDLDNMRRLKAGEIPGFTVEKRYNRKDGKIVWVLLIVSPLLFPGGQIETHIAVVHDITEKKRTEYALQYSEAEVRKLNAELERRVAERTVQLEMANKELEAFSYSVSHDLRAPLRAIDGFSRIILEEHAFELAGEVHELLQHVNAESKRMGQLIDALLSLARMSRTEMRNETVDLSSLAHQVMDGLHQSQPQRLVECVIADGVTVQGDARLLHIALENLLGNAWKFTSRRKQAHIEFGMDKRENELVYFVCDDGAGFDLAYADKLFGAFQRMHRSEEFEGTGIGLATVQRIIQRHGGRVWAESEVGKGATFYFTLGK